MDSDKKDPGHAMVKVYAFDSPSAGTLISDYRSVVAKEVFDGEIRMDPQVGTTELTLTRGAHQPVPIFSLSASLDTSMRRNWNHIRSTQRQVYLLWLVREGRLRMSINASNHVSEEGTVAVFDPSLPFISECLVGAKGRHRSIFAAIPVHIFRTFVPDFHGFAGTPFSANSADGRVLHDIVAMLFDEGDELDARLARDLLEVALKCLQRLVLTKRDRAVISPLVREDRLKAIEAYIDNNLASPDLSLLKVAQSLKVTTRYVSYLLKGANISFVALVCQKRLKLAQAWLNSRDAEHLTIGQIAMLSGFKSLTQFGRAFRAHFGVSPSVFRFQQVGQSRAKMRPTSD